MCICSCTYVSYAVGLDSVVVEPLSGCWELTLSPRHEKQALLTTHPSLQPHKDYFWKIKIIYAQFRLSLKSLSLFYFFEAGSPSVARVVLELTVCHAAIDLCVVLLQLAECRDYRHTPPCLTVRMSLKRLYHCVIPKIIPFIMLVSLLLIAFSCQLETCIHALG